MTSIVFFNTYNSLKFLALPLSLLLNQQEWPFILLSVWKGEWRKALSTSFWADIHQLTSLLLDPSVSISREKPKAMLAKSVVWDSEYEVEWLILLFHSPPFFQWGQATATSKASMLPMIRYNLHPRNYMEQRQQRVDWYCQFYKQYKCLWYNFVDSITELAQGNYSKK